MSENASRTAIANRTSESPLRPKPFEPRKAFTPKAFTLEAVYTKPFPPKLLHQNRFAPQFTRNPSEDCRVCAEHVTVGLSKLNRVAPKKADFDSFPHWMHASAFLRMSSTSVVLGTGGKKWYLLVVLCLDYWIQFVSLRPRTKQRTTGTWTTCSMCCTGMSTTSLDRDQCTKLPSLTQSDSSQHRWMPYLNMGVVLAFMLHDLWQHNFLLQVRTCRDVLQ